MPEWTKLRERLAGKWQIPLFVCSILLLAGSFIRINPATKPESLEAAAEALGELVAGGSYDRAIGLAVRVLAREDEYSATQPAPIHLQLARAYCGDALRRQVPTEDVGRRIVDHYRWAFEGGQALTAADYERIGWAHEWQGEPAVALQYFERAVASGIDDRSQLRRHMIQLHQDKLGTDPKQVDQLLDEFLTELEDHRLDLRLWGLERKLGVLEALDRLKDASTLLVRDEERFRASDLANRFDYLKALVLYKTGHYDEAETFLRTVRNRVERRDDVHGMTGWLLGRVVLEDGGPQRPLEALSFFTDVITYHPGSPYAVASRLGQAEALASLERHDDAIGTYRLVLDDLPSQRPNALINVDVLRTSLAVMADAQRRGGNLEAALGYARLATELLDRRNHEQTSMSLQQLAQILSLRGDELAGQRASGQNAQDGGGDSRAVDARRLYAEAAVTFLELARIDTFNEQRSADWSWQAAKLFAMAGELPRAVELYRAFAMERPGHSLVPRALLRIAQLRWTMGQVNEAIETYRECYRRFPRTLEGSRALVPLAECYLAEGPGSEELAEKTLNLVLADSEVFTPQAPEFADALFLLGEVRNRRGAFEQAIATLEEALERYPDDPREAGAFFLLADSYRRSALALKKEAAEAEFAGEIQRIGAESATRFEKARKLYRRLIGEYEVRGIASLNRLEKLYFRHATLYEADCFFETGDYGQALARYEAAAATFKDSPTALAAYVQIINCHVFLSQPLEARAALARALILVDAIPRAGFGRSVSPETHRDWKRYFEWLGESELF